MSSTGKNESPQFHPLDWAAIARELLLAGKESFAQLVRRSKRLSTATMERQITSRVRRHHQEIKTISGLISDDTQSRVGIIVSGGRNYKQAMGSKHKFTPSMCADEAVIARLMVFIECIPPTKRTWLLLLPPMFTKGHSRRDELCQR